MANDPPRPPRPQRKLPALIRQDYSPEFVWCPDCDVMYNGPQCLLCGRETDEVSKSDGWNKES